MRLTDNHSDPTVMKETTQAFLRHVWLLPSTARDTDVETLFDGRSNVWWEMAQQSFQQNLAHSRAKLSHFTFEAAYDL